MPVATSRWLPDAGGPGSGGSAEGVRVAVQSGAEVIDLRKIESVSRMGRDSIDQVVVTRVERMTLQSIVLIVAQCCKNRIAFAGSECDILHRQVFPRI